jgi:hypothetical protein
MTSEPPTARTLPARPSLESLRKQAKALARKAAARNEQATARVRAQLPKWEIPLSLRDAQLVIAREYGFAGWRELREEVLKRIGKGLDWAALEAERAIHKNDAQRLKQLIADESGLLAWRDEDGCPLLQATTPYAMDVSDPEREAQFCRPDCAALLIDAGALVTPSVWEALICSGAAGMLQLLRDKGVLPRTLAVLAATGDAEGVRHCLTRHEGTLLEAVNWAFMSACRFKREAIANELLERAINLDAGLGAQIDRWRDRAAFVGEMIADCPSLYGAQEPWAAFVMREVLNATDSTAFSKWLDDQPWLLDHAQLALQVQILEMAAVFDREEFILGLLERAPAVLHPPPPPSDALNHAFSYGNAHLVPLLTRVWPLPDDLPHAAGVGDLERVQRWFDDRGQPALGDVLRHFRNHRPGAPTVQQVLDVAFAWAVLNEHVEVAEFLLAHGADINTDWSTHEPASILHECAIQGRYDCARFLVEHGIDLTIRDHRWNATAAGWALHAANDKKMAMLLMDAERRR